MDPFSAGAQARGPVEKAARARLNAGRLAQRGPSDEAVAALPASGPPHQADAVPGREPGDARPDGLDHTGALVPGDDRQRAPQVPGEIVLVAVADAGRLDPDEDLFRVWLVEPDVADDKGCTETFQQRGSHPTHPSPTAVAAAAGPGTPPSPAASAQAMNSIAATLGVTNICRQ